MVSVKVTTTLDADLRRTAREKHIRLSDALEIGLRKMLRQPFIPDANQTIDEESVLSKKTRQANVLQEQLLEAQQEIYDLKGGGQDDI